MRFVFLFLCFSCQKKEVTSAANSCDVTCPPGTYYDEYRSERETTSAYEDFQEAECRYTCIANAECPEGYWPVISTECFTCAVSLPDGGSGSLSCDETQWWDDRDDEPDGQLDVGDRGGDVPVEPALSSEFKSATFVDGFSLDFEPNGLAHDGTHLWAGDWVGQSVKAIDLESGLVVNEVDIGDVNPTSMCSDRQKLWIGTGSNLLSFDIETGDFGDSISGSSCAWNGEFLVVPDGGEIYYYDRDTLQRDHHSYRDAGGEETDSFAAWFAGHLVQVRSETLDVFSIHFFAWDLSDWTDHPLMGDFVFDWDVYPVSGMTMVDNHLVVTGKLSGEYANKLSIFRID